MTYLKNTMLLSSVIAAAFLLPVTIGSPYTISDDRVRSLDITPVLGRGYSVGTNSYQSTCLMVDEVTTPSYNYDYKFSDFSSERHVENALEGAVSASFGFWKIKAEVSLSAMQNGKFNSKTRMIVATMRIERYYSSVKEELSPLSEDALTLLDRQDYIGFFKSCGPNYVRSLRRAQELSTIFKFSSSSAEESMEFGMAIQISTPTVGAGFAVSAKSKFQAITSSLEISILGYGLGLNAEGSSTLVSATLEEYEEVLKFAFKSFTQADGPNIGMVYGMEIVPWVDNTAFQVASKILEENVIIPLPRSMIPKATNNVDATPFANTEAVRNSFSCKNEGYNIDKYGYCCEPSMLWQPGLSPNPGYGPELYNITISTAVCRPARTLDKSVVKNNMSNNGEFVAHLDSIIRYRMNQLFTLQKCVSATKAFSSKYDFHILKPRDTAKYDAALDFKFTMLELKIALDPTNNFDLLKIVGEELDEFVEMYYQPCIAALFGSNVGTSSDVEPQYFLSYGWLTHTECTHLTCLADNMRWDRNIGGCHASVIIGGNAPAYAEADDQNTNCAKTKTPLSGSDVEQCKFPSTVPTVFQTAANACWGDISPFYMMSQFCMPVLNGETTDRIDKDAVDLRRATCAAYQ